MTSRSELREHLRAKYGSRAKAAAAPKPTPERAFVTHAESGRTVITAPLREVASYNPHYLNLTGRFVEADNPNRNGAYWTSGDLHLGNATVAGGPLNWLHQEHQIVGSLTRSAFEVGDAEVGNHIVADAVLWSFLFPDHHSLAIEAAADENLYYCVDPETEMLTARGWMRYEDLEVGELVYTADIDSGMAGWQPLQAVNVFDHDGKMLALEGQQHSSLTTDNHRWFVSQRTKTGPVTQWRRSDQLTQASAVPRTLPGMTPVTPTVSDALVELLAWFWTEGSIQGRGVTIYQSHVANPVKNHRIAAALKSLFGSAGKVRDGGLWYASRHGRMTHFHLCAAAATLLLELAPDKVVRPEFFGTLTQSQLELFINTSIDGDGTRSKADGQVSITQASEDRIRSFEVACALAGIPTNTTEYVAPAGFDKGGDIRMWRTCLVRRSMYVYPKRNSELAERGKRSGSSAEWVEYSGKVWCPTTPNGTFLARRRGTVYWTGNSMECISEYVECMACYQEVSYADYNAKMCCSHLAERGAVRRFKNPIFLGGAVIVPPVQPGWANADLKLGRSAAALVEQANLSAGNMTSTQALDLAAAVLSWANRD